jgi:ribonuclease VapC
VTWFVDASAVVAIIGKEDDWHSFADRLDQEQRRIWSAMAQWESVAGVRSRLKISPALARLQVAEFAERRRLSLVPIGAVEGVIALDAFERYGKGAGHRAQLNLGDCFAYACAKTNGARLLYKGDDFVHTDLA